VSLRGWLSARLAGGQPPADEAPQWDVELPPAIAARLYPDNTLDPLWPKARAFGRGIPGVTRENHMWWVIRDDRGRVVGGVRVATIGPGHPPGLDVTVDPRRRRQGWASALYRAVEAAGVDLEAASDASLAHRAMTPLGFAFMLRRRQRTDPDALTHIALTAHACPGCGPLP